MNIIIKLEIHAFAEEKICDWYFDAHPSYGLYGPEIMLPLKAKRGCILALPYDESTTVGQVISAVKKEIWGASKYADGAPTSYSFINRGERYYIENFDGNFRNLLSKYFDPEASGKATLCILISCDAGTVCSKNRLRYYVNSHEAGKHHVPHIHVQDMSMQYEGSVRISDGEVLAGNLPPKLAREAKETILADQEFFYHCWNTKTDGIQVDINRHYGYIQY